MTYCTQADMEAAYGFEELVKSQPLANPPVDPPALDTRAISAAIQAASDEIDSYVMQRYRLPLAAELAERLKHRCVDIAMYHLGPTVSAQDDLKHKRYDDAVEWLKDAGQAGEGGPGAPPHRQDHVGRAARVPPRHPLQQPLHAARPHRKVFMTRRLCIVNLSNWDGEDYEISVATAAEGARTKVLKPGESMDLPMSSKPGAVTMAAVVAESESRTATRTAFQVVPRKPPSGGRLRASPAIAAPQVTPAAQPARAIEGRRRLFEVFRQPPLPARHGHPQPRIADPARHAETPPHPRGRLPSPARAAPPSP